MRETRKKRVHANPGAAPTSEVIGTGRGGSRVPAKWKRHYTHLVELRNHLLSSRGDQIRDATDEQPSFSLHMADAGTDSFDRDFALSRISAEQDAIYEIDEALDRIRQGSFGICELTGKPIEPRRLEAIPWTRFCSEAAAKLEREGKIPHDRLSPRQHIARGDRGIVEDTEMPAPEEPTREVRPDTP